MNDMENAQRTSFYHKGSKVGFGSYLPRDHDWWDEFGMRFRVEFSPGIEVRKLAMEFQDLRQIMAIMAEITAKFSGEGIDGFVVCCK